MARKYCIIGITDDAELEPSSAVLKIITENKVFSGGLRHHQLVERFLPLGATWIDITVPLDGVFDAYKEHQEIVVFASGDPLFLPARYKGEIRRRLSKSFPPSIRYNCSPIAAYSPTKGCGHSPSRGDPGNASNKP